MKTSNRDSVLLSVEGLTIQANNSSQKFYPVRNVSFDIFPGQTFALVGESGSGKSLTALSVLDLLPEGLSRLGGVMRFRGEIIRRNAEPSFGSLRGREIAMIFQEPAAALNPVFRVGYQMRKVVQTHLKYARREAEAHVLRLLNQVGMAEPHRAYRIFPHQLSGGMAQRVMIAMALSCKPKLIIADEPTTALDVFTQKRVLQLILRLQQQYAFSLLLITHDLNLVARFADTIGVMKNGELVEKGNTPDVLFHAQHPYTLQLLRSAFRDFQPAGDYPDAGVQPLKQTG